MKFETIQNLFFFGFLGLSTILFFWLIGSFAYTIFWAIFFTIVFYPLYENILKKTKKKEILSTTLTTILIIFSVLIPLSFTTYVVIDQIPKVSKTFLEKQNIETVLSNIPFKDKIDLVLIKNKIDPNKIEEQMIESTKKSLNSFSGKIISFSQNIFEIIMNLFLMFYIIFFGLKDGKKYLLRLSKILPLGDKTERRLFKKFSSIVRSIFKGTLIVSLVQGLIAGLLFYIVGFKGIIVWTILLIISSMIPALGSGLITIPATMYLFFTGDFSGGIILTIGIILISTIDNVLRPYLIGHETEIPDMLITISILAGLSLIGITGLVIGPVIAGFFLVMWHMFEEKYNDRLDNNE